jgi:hypothetical protein
MALPGDGDGSLTLFHEFEHSPEELAFLEVFGDPPEDVLSAGKCLHRPADRPFEICHEKKPQGETGYDAYYPLGSLRNKERRRT